MDQANTEDSTLPLLPMRAAPPRPGEEMSMFVGRPASTGAVNRAKAAGNHLLLVAQRDRNQYKAPTLADLEEVGTIARLLNVLKLPDGTLKVQVRGEALVRLVAVEDAAGHLTGRFALGGEAPGAGPAGAAA